MRRISRAIVLAAIVAAIDTVQLIAPIHASGPTYVIIDHPSSEPPQGANLGHSVAALDWNADGVLDIAAGAPVRTASMYFSARHSRAMKLSLSTDSLEMTDSGNKITAGNLENTSGDELVIAAPKANIGSIEKAGAVWVSARNEHRVRKLTSDEPRGDGMFGNDVAVGDFNADGRLDVVASSPGLTGGPSTGTATLFLNTTGMFDDHQKVILRNHQMDGNANFGHDLAVCDWNSDARDDLCVGAIWNTNSKGIEGGGHFVLYVGSIGADDQGVERRVFDDNRSSADDKIVRWGMSIDGRDQTILVGSPRKDVPPVLDAGMGFAFRPGQPVRNYAPQPVENGILGYRARVIDLIGDATPDLAFMSLPVGTYVWDGAEPDRDPIFYARPRGASSHWCSGAVAAQVVPGWQGGTRSGQPSLESRRQAEILAVGKAPDHAGGY